MEDSTARGSIFSQGLDRTSFTAYFLGAVVPLVALAYVVQRYVLPTLEEPALAWGLVGLVVSIAVLSLSAFLTLRKSTHRVLRRIDRDNRRLSSLLRTSSALTDSELAGDIANTTVSCALELSGARAAYLMIGGKDAGADPELFGAAGEDAEALFGSYDGRLLELTRPVIGQGKPLIKRGGHRADDLERGLAAAVVLPLLGESRAIGALAVVHTDENEDFDDAQVDAMSTLASLTAVAMRNSDLRDSQRNFFSHMTEILVTALDSHLDYHGGHGNRVARNAHRIGRELGFDGPRLQNLHFASLLHDIGMLRFDRSSRQNPKACEKHTVLGGRMLGRIRLWEDIAPIVHHHHEWFDGRGYPDGLAGESIPLESRIVAVCDAFDAMTSDTSYQLALPVEQALAEVRSGAGTQFDPDIVTCFAELLQRGEIET